MTKKHYIAIARALNALVWNYQGEKVAQDVLLSVVDTLSEVFKGQNVRFNKDRFIEAVYKK